MKKPNNFWHLVNNNPGIKVYIIAKNDEVQPQLNLKQIIRKYKSRIHGMIEEWIKDHQDHD